MAVTSIPKQYLCDITGLLMLEPMSAKCDIQSHLFDRKAIEAHINEVQQQKRLIDGRVSCPVHKDKPLVNLESFNSLKKRIHEYIVNHPQNFGNKTPEELQREAYLLFDNFKIRISHGTPASHIINSVREVLPATVASRKKELNEVCIALRIITDFAVREIGMDLIKSLKLALIMAAYCGTISALMTTSAYISSICPYETIPAATIALAKIGAGIGLAKNLFYKANSPRVVKSFKDKLLTYKQPILMLTGTLFAGLIAGSPAASAAFLMFSLPQLARRFDKHLVSMYRFLTYPLMMK